MPHVSTTHSARILMAGTSASAMMASFSTRMALLATMLTNALMELTHVTQQHKNVETLLVVLHVNVNLDSFVMTGFDGGSNCHTDATCAESHSAYSS